ncbi:MAG: helix-turn-helix domain-containing protein [Candidatus Micrarchaeota archaeon]|nr:helix-turn-helix domain-containing protein [Candidatus Micrarchaeota archaeon]
MNGWQESGPKSSRVRDGRSEAQRGLFSGIAAISRSGRTRALSEEKVELARDLYFNELLSVRAVADVLGVSHMTVWRALQELEKEGGGELGR